MKPAVLALAVAAGAAPMWAGNVIYSDLGTGSNVYNTSSNSWGVQGSANAFSPGLADGIAALFMAQGSGSEAVGQIDLGMWNFSGLQSFTASIWTDVAGKPGAQVSGALWSLAATNAYPGCCALASVTGISGVSLTGGQQYFMVLQPVSYSDNSSNAWIYNSQSVSGDMQSTTNGTTWSDLGTTSNFAAFDVIGGSSTAPSAPEPASFALGGFGLAALVMLRRRRA